MTSDIRISFKGKAIAAALELLLPGTGHFALGSSKQALGWFGANFLSFAGIVGAVLGDSLSAFWVAVGLAIFLRFACVAHCFFVKEYSLPSWRNVVVIFVGANIASYIVTELVKAHVISAYRIPSGSMLPAVKMGDHIMVSKLNRTPRRGDIIAFRSPKNPDDMYVKRVIALAGDTVQTRDDEVILNDKLITTDHRIGGCSFTKECELLEETIGQRTYRVMITHESSPAREPKNVPVLPGAVFVLGDNRDNSVDSRTFGPLPLENIVGHVQFTWWSSNHDGS